MFTNMQLFYIMEAMGKKLIILKSNPNNKAVAPARKPVVKSKETFKKAVNAAKPKPLTKAEKKVVALKRLFLKSFINSAANISKACVASKVGRGTYYDWIKKDKYFLESCEFVEESLIDHVESKLKERIDGVECQKIGPKGEVIIYGLPPDVRAIEVFLKAKARARGYSNIQEYIDRSLVDVPSSKDIENCEDDKTASASYEKMLGK